jgi:type I restriction enzyme S subunit
LGLNSNVTNVFKSTNIGSIPVEWNIVHLIDALDLLTDGSHFSPKEKKKGSYYMASVKDMTEHKINLNSCKRIEKDAFERLTKANCKPKRGDVLFSKDGTMGICFVFNQSEPIVVLSSIAILRPSKEFNSYFLKYYLSNNRILNLIISGHSSGSALPRLTLTNLKDIPVVKPSIKEQHAVAKILSDLDSKIELNTQMNKTLESIAQTVFKRWFIDFEFLNENGEPYKSSGGEMVDTELGEIPKGWMVKPIDAIANFLNGLPLQKYPAIDWNDYLPVVKIKELNDGITDSTDKANSNVPKDYIVNDGDILFSWSGSLNVVIWCNGKGALNQHLFKVTSDIYPKWIYYHWLVHYLPNYVEIAKEKATTMGHIQRHHLQESLVKVPDERTLDEMSQIFSPILENTIINKIENRHLINVRNSLLPKLMSGKIRVPLVD